MAGSCLWTQSFSSCLFTGLLDLLHLRLLLGEFGYFLWLFFWLMLWLKSWYSSSSLPVIIPGFQCWTCLTLSRLFSHRTDSYVLMNAGTFFHMQFSLRYVCSASLHFMNWLSLVLPLNALSSSSIISTYLAGCSNLGRQWLTFRTWDIFSLHFPGF